MQNLFHVSPLFRLISRYGGMACGALAFGLVAVTGCDRMAAPDARIAVVDGNALTRYHLKDELAARGGVADQASRALAIQALVDRQLLQDEAVRLKLDRDPHVRAALDNARAQILAQAYLKSRMAQVEPLSAGEAKAYFAAHPEQFSERKLFHIKEIAISSQQASGELQAAMDAARSLDDVTAWLEGRRIPYRQARRTLDSAEMPMALATRMRDMQPGQLFVMREADSTFLATLVAAEARPVALADALPQIHESLRARAARALGDAALARLRTGAYIEYTDEQNALLAKAGTAEAPARKNGPGEISTVANLNQDEVAK